MAYKLKLKVPIPEILNQYIFNLVLPYIIEFCYHIYFTLDL